MNNNSEFTLAPYARVLEIILFIHTYIFGIDFKNIVYFGIMKYHWSYLILWCLPIFISVFRLTEAVDDRIKKSEETLYYTPYSIYLPPHDIILECRG